MAHLYTIFTHTTSSTLDPAWRSFLADASSSSLVLTLPTILCDGIIFDIKRSDNIATNTVTVVPTGPALIDGLTSISLFCQQGRSIISKDDNWYTIHSDNSSLEVANTIFVDVTYGDDSTGTPDQPGLPFLTLNAARAAADLVSKPVNIRVHPGYYKGTKLDGDQVNWTFDNGTTIEAEGVLFQGLTGTVTGYSVWGMANIICNIAGQNVIDLTSGGNYRIVFQANSIQATSAACIRVADEVAGVFVIKDTLVRTGTYKNSGDPKESVCQLYSNYTKGTGVTINANAIIAADGEVCIGLPKIDQNSKWVVNVPVIQSLGPIAIGKENGSAELTVNASEIKSAGPNLSATPLAAATICHLEGGIMRITADKLTCDSSGQASCHRAIYAGSLTAGGSTIVDIAELTVISGIASKIPVIHVSGGSITGSINKADVSPLNLERTFVLTDGGSTYVSIDKLFGPVTGRVWDISDGLIPVVVNQQVNEINYGSLLSYNGTNVNTKIVLEIGRSETGLTNGIAINGLAGICTISSKQTVSSCSGPFISLVTASTGIFGYTGNYISLTNATGSLALLNGPQEINLRFDDINLTGAGITQWLGNLQLDFGNISIAGTFYQDVNDANKTADIKFGTLTNATNTTIVSVTSTATQVNINGNRVISSSISANIISVANGTMNLTLQQLINNPGVVATNSQSALSVSGTGALFASIQQIRTQGTIWTNSSSSECSLDGQVAESLGRTTGEMTNGIVLTGSARTSINLQLLRIRGSVNAGIAAVLINTSTAGQSLDLNITRITWTTVGAGAARPNAVIMQGTQPKLYGIINQIDLINGIRNESTSNTSQLDLNGQNYNVAGGPVLFSSSAGIVRLNVMMAATTTGQALIFNRIAGVAMIGEYNNYYISGKYTSAAGSTVVAITGMGVGSPSSGNGIMFMDAILICTLASSPITFTATVGGANFGIRPMTIYCRITPIGGTITNTSGLPAPNGIYLGAGIV